MAEIITCPHCASQLTSTKSAAYADSHVVKCQHCEQDFSLGTGRSKSTSGRDGMRTATLNTVASELYEVRQMLDGRLPRTASTNRVVLAGFLAAGAFCCLLSPLTTSAAPILIGLALFAVMY